jgi:cell division control protein 12
MLDLISTTEEIHYENYRQAQMETRPPGQPRPGKSDNPRFREEEEALRKRFTEQVRPLLHFLFKFNHLVLPKVKSEESRFRQWEQHLIAERDKLNKDLEIAHGNIKALEAELDNMQVGYNRNTTRR